MRARIRRIIAERTAEFADRQAEREAKRAQNNARQLNYARRRRATPPVSIPKNSPLFLRRKEAA